MESNNWEENPDGQTYISRISTEGPSDLLGWGRDFLAPRVQRVFEDFSAKYDWGNPGQIRFSRNQSGAGRPSGNRSIPEAQSSAAQAKGPEQDLTCQNIFIGV